MPSHATPVSLDLAVWLLTAAVGAGVEPLLAAGGKVPVPVSPGAEQGGSITEARCPTFSWGGVAEAPGYELAVFRVLDGEAGEPELVTRVWLPADSRAWTPSVGQCLVRGERYAWSVAARDPDVGEGALEWAPAFLFEVEDADPTARREDGASPFPLGEVGTEGSAGERGAPNSVPRGNNDLTRIAATARDPRRLPLSADARRVREQGRPVSTVPRVAAAASTPSQSAASLAVSAQVHLGAASDLFKDGEVFLWDDNNGNTALGRSALSSVTGTAHNNTAFGSGALENTMGGEVYHGSYNTAAGTQALQANTTGRNNTGIGAFALLANTTGYSNTATGTSALIANTTGRDNTAAGFLALGSNVTGRYSVAIGARALESNGDSFRNTAVGYRALGNTNSLGLYTGWRNIAVGDRAGLNLTSGFSNIFIGNQGQSNDSKTIRIGYTSGSQFIGHNKVYIAGIHNVTPGLGGALSVVVDANGQLGTVASSRDLKQDVRDLGSLVDRLLELRPVSFRYKQHVASDPDAPPEFGLIAEEVAEVFPELVVYDEDGKPQTVRYHLLSSLLLGEAQKQHALLEEQRRQVERQEAENTRLRARLAAIEARLDRMPRRDAPRPSLGSR